MSANRIVNEPVDPQHIDLHPLTTKTIKVKHKVGGEMLINESDFNPDIHEKLTGVVARVKPGDQTPPAK